MNKAKSRRNYSLKTVEILYGLSGNRCAFPGCTINLIEPATEESDAAVIAQKSHIYAISTAGPRGTAGLTEKELNSHENLILLCPTHHALVDAQPETYTAEILKKWKQTHEAKLEKRFSETIENVQSDIISNKHFPTNLVDQKINEEINILRKSRFFPEFNRTQCTLVLARKVAEGEFSGGSDSTRCQALAWCARLLSPTEELDKAEKYLGLAKQLETCQETDIAAAFISSQRGDKEAALSTLSSIDSPASRSAAFIIILHHDGPQGAIDWLKLTGNDASDLDSDDKHYLLACHLQLGNWETARESLDLLTDNDLDNTPALHRIRAITHLISTVPEEFRTTILEQSYFHIKDFPLASDGVALEARRSAQCYFIAAAEAARQLNCPDAAKMDDHYALWLELMDPDKRYDGKKRLESKLRDPKTALHLVHLGLQFGINLDFKAVEREIERQIALNGGITYDAAIARFALVFTQKSPEDAANYIERHHDELVEYIAKKSLKFLQIDLLSQAGLPERANEHLDILVQEGVSDSEESRLRELIAEAKGADPIEGRKKQFKKTASINDLRSLVDALETKGNWNDLCEYGKILFEKTGALRDAERLASALNNTHKNEELITFLKSNNTYVTQSGKLQMLFCWSLYHEGELLEARHEAAKLDSDWDDPNYRALQINLGISSGDWNSLSSLIAKERREKDKRNAQQLISIAQLALHLESYHAKELIFTAAQKGGNDADILATAYFLASNAGWESEPETSQWLHKAASLSRDNGPIRLMTLKDMLDQKPEWERRETEIWQLFTRGDIPMSIAAEFLNKSLISLMLFPALANLSGSDPRRRSLIPAYSGNRQPISLDTGGRIGIDATALLTLSFLGLLDKALDSFDTVYIPHSTLRWLFQEKQKVTFHQPSRIKAAHKIRDLLATDVLEKLAPSTVPDSDLSEQVGEDLAQLIAEAEKVKHEDDPQCIVVQPSPVYRIASLMEEEADLTAHEAVLSSCLSIVDKLRQKGLLTTNEEQNARAYLQLHEKPWPNQPQISDGAILYLDDLAITYFLDLGILEKLKVAGFRVIVSPKKVSEANQLISYENISNKVKDSIEGIRFAINSRIESGKIKVGRRSDTDQSAVQSRTEDPTTDIFSLTKICDALILDDRFLNQHPHIDNTTPIFSTLELLDALDSTGSITDEERMEYKTRLRQAGYIFVPVSEEELAHHLDVSTIKKDKIIETAELKAIRENILSIRMSTWLQFPKEASWLDSSLGVFIQVLKGIWQTNADISSIRVRSDWLLNQIDVRGWAHCFNKEYRQDIDKSKRGPLILMILTPVIDAHQKVNSEYWNWVEESILIPIKEDEADFYSWIIEWQRRIIARMVELASEQWEEEKDSPELKSVLAQTALNMVCPLIRDSLLDDADFLQEYSFITNAVLSFGNFDMSFRCSNLSEAARKVLSGVPEKKVIDMKGQKWRLKNLAEKGDIPRLSLSRGKQHLHLLNFAAFSPDKDIRLRFLEMVTRDFNLPDDISESWRGIFAQRSLEDGEVCSFHSELFDTPIAKESSISGQILDGGSSISSLVPSSRRYFERLVGVYDGSASIRDYASGGGRTFFERLSKWRPYDGFLYSLFLSSHSSMTDEINVNQLNSSDLVRAFEFVDKHGDRTSQVGAIEVGLRVLSSRPEIEQILIHLIEQIRDDDVEGQTSGFKLLSSLFYLVDGELSRLRLFSADPPFYRRLAALSHAALIHRQLVNSPVDANRFSEWACDNRGGYYMQSLADMRLEPCWDPDYSIASQIKADFFGRIMNAGKIHEQNITASPIYDLVLTNKTGSLQSISNSFYPYLPGPLEGTEGMQDIVPVEIAEMIETQLSANKVAPSSFIAIVNFALIHRIGADQAELAAKTLKLANYRLQDIESKQQLIAILSGLAKVAAVARSPALADELRILVRKHRYDVEYAISLDEAIRICLVATASRSDLNDWAEFIGDWLTELAFSDLKDDEGQVFYLCLDWLCHAVPDLWVFCSRTNAALMAFNAK